MKLTGILKKINDGIINRESFRNGRLDHFEHDCITYSDQRKTNDSTLKKSGLCHHKAT